jgi:hypothetical protein
MDRSAFVRIPISMAACLAALGPGHSGPLLQIGTVGDPRRPPGLLPVPHLRVLLIYVDVQYFRRRQLHRDAAVPGKR